MSSKADNKQKEIIIEWFSKIVECYSEKLINQDDILTIIVKSIDSKYKSLLKNILNLVCKLAEKNDNYL